MRRRAGVKLRPKLKGKTKGHWHGSSDATSYTAATTPGRFLRVCRVDRCRLCLFRFLVSVCEVDCKIVRHQRVGKMDIQSIEREFRRIMKSR